MEVFGGGGGKTVDRASDAGYGARRCLEVPVGVRVLASSSATDAT
jgi:hypothetical protein